MINEKQKSEREKGIAFVEAIKNAEKLKEEVSTLERKFEDPKDTLSKLYASTLIARDTSLYSCLNRNYTTLELFLVRAVASDPSFQDTELYTQTFELLSARYAAQTAVKEAKRISKTPIRKRDKRFYERMIALRRTYKASEAADITGFPRNESYYQEEAKERRCLTDEEIAAIKPAQFEYNPQVRGKRIDYFLELRDMMLKQQFSKEHELRKQAQAREAAQNK